MSNKLSHFPAKNNILDRSMRNMLDCDSQLYTLHYKTTITFVANAPQISLNRKIDQFSIDSTKIINN